MRRREKHLPTETPQTLLRTPDESSKILGAMVQMANRIGKPFSEARLQQLHDDLGPYPVAAIEWSLDSWGRNSKVLPTLSDLLQLLRTWHVASQAEGCDCKHLHGTGYGWEDLKWMLKKRGLHAERFSIAQWEELIAEMDSKREGGSPSWRKTPGGQRFLRAE